MSSTTWWWEEDEPKERKRQHALLALENINSELKWEKSELIDNKCNYFGFVEFSKLLFIKRQHWEIFNSVPSNLKHFFFWETIRPGNTYKSIGITFTDGHQMSNYFLEVYRSNSVRVSFIPTQFHYFSSFKSALTAIIKEHCRVAGCEQISQYYCKCIPLKPAPWFDAKGKYCFNSKYVMKK